MDDGGRGARGEVTALREALDRMGVGHEDHDAVTSFLNEAGDCCVFPSVQREGMLYVTYVSSAYVRTAEEALAACGVGAES